MKKNNTGLNILQSISLLILIIIVEAVFGLVISLIVSAVLNVRGIHSESIYNSTLIYIKFVSQLTTYILVIWWAFKKKSNHIRIEYRLGLRVYLFSVLVMIGYSLIFHNSILILISDINASLTKSIPTSIPVEILAVIIAPVVEEIIFRGILLEQLSRKYNAVVSILVSSLLFSIFHFSIVQGVNTFIMGVLLGIVYIKTRSLVPCVLMHFVNNLIPVIAISLPTIFINGFSMIQFIFGILILVISIFIYTKINNLNFAKDTSTM